MQQRLAAVGEMAAGIAHEIRNPLASMSGSIQVLRQELPLSDEQAQLMDIVLRESERLNDTIQSFLAYARPQRVALTRLDIRRVVQDTATLLRNSADVQRGSRRRRRPARRAGLVRGRREPDPPDPLEPRHQRAARHAVRRPAAAVGEDARRAAAEEELTHHDRGRGLRHSAGRSRQPLPAVPQLVRQGHRARPGHRPPDRDRLQRLDSGVVDGRHRHDGPRPAADAIASGSDRRLRRRSRLGTAHRV